MKFLLLILKMDCLNSPIKGSSFVLEQNNIVIRDNIKTDENGMFKVENLSRGTYVLKETSSNPWFSNMKDQIIKIDSDKEIVIHSKSISPSNIKIINKDIFGNNIKSEFVIYKDNIEVGTNDTGGLVSGVYTIRQKSVDSKFFLDNKIYKVKINPGETKLIKVINKRKSI